MLYFRSIKKGAPVFPRALDNCVKFPMMKSFRALPILGFAVFIAVVFFAAPTAPAALTASAAEAAASPAPAAPAAAPADFSIINIHEHMRSLWDAKRILPLMDELGISKMVLLGSPRQTFYPGTIRDQKFDEPDRNNWAVLRMQRKWPDRFLAFCVFQQEDPKIVDKLKFCLYRGAKGVKLFSGHGSFHTIPLDDPSLNEFYNALEEKQTPILWHVNTGKYFDEFKAVLEAHPKLKIICAHYCLASKSRSKLRFLLETYPNVSFDTSFGSPEVLQQGIDTLKEGKEEFRELFMQYPTRFMFGTDYVLTKEKTPDGIRENFAQNRELLEKTLELPQDILKKIYEENFINFL